MDGRRGASNVGGQFCHPRDQPGIHFSNRLFPAERRHISGEDLVRRDVVHGKIAAGFLRALRGIARHAHTRQIRNRGRAAAERQR